MIDESVMDKIIPIPEEEKEKLKAVIEREFYSWLEDKWEK